MGGVDLFPSYRLLPSGNPNSRTSPSDLTNTIFLYTVARLIVGKSSFISAWIFSTLGMVIKHNIFYEMIICLKFVHKRNWIRVPLLTISVLLFLLSFVPFWGGAKEAIINNVFLYPSGTGIYGITSLINFPYIQFLFVAALFVFPFLIKTGDIIKQCLLGVLFFLVFTTGIGIQYFILPIAPLTAVTSIVVGSAITWFAGDIPEDVGVAFDWGHSQVSKGSKVWVYGSDTNEPTTSGDGGF